MAAERRIAGKRRSRALLRAFNGAGIGALPGGVLGIVPGGVFAYLVLGPADWRLGAVFGVPAGLVGGAPIGLTMAIRNHLKGWWAAVGMGLAVGGAYSVLLRGIAWSDHPAIGGSMLASGLLGGALLGTLLRILRMRSGWWTRWDAEASTVLSGSGNHGN